MHNMSPKKIIILGSTGSIGTQTLDVIRQHPRHFKVVGLACGANESLLRAQAREFGVKNCVVGSESELCALAEQSEADIVVCAISGARALLPLYKAVRAGKHIALASKEAFVMAGPLLLTEAKKSGARIVPIDSEMSAIFQVLESAHQGRMHISKVYLTCSGGPFWGKSRKELENVTVEQALKHPTWKMSRKISVDSATLMNKALEIIEAAYLFNLKPEQIEVLIHPESKVHAIVEFIDGSSVAQIAPTDMRFAIQYALFYPERVDTKLPKLNFADMTLHFEKPRYAIFEGPQLAYSALRKGGLQPALLAMANEHAVEKFLKKEISFLEICDVIKTELTSLTRTATRRHGAVSQRQNHLVLEHLLSL